VIFRIFLQQKSIFRIILEGNSAAKKRGKVIFRGIYRKERNRPPPEENRRLRKVIFRAAFSVQHFPKHFLNIFRATFLEIGRK
jgi:hypothetical protein